MQALDAKIGEAERLLRLADPDGYYREGTRAAQVAKSKGAKAAAVERARREAAERQRRERLVRLCLPLSQYMLYCYQPNVLSWCADCQQDEGLHCCPTGCDKDLGVLQNSFFTCLLCAHMQDAKAKEEAFVPEVDEEEEDHQRSAAQQAAGQPQPAGPAANGHTGSAPAAGNAEQRQQAAGDALAQDGGPPGAVPGEAVVAPAAAHVAAAPEQVQEEKSTLHRLAAEVPGTAMFGLEVRARPAPGGQLLSREELRAQRAAAARKLRGAGEEDPADAAGAGGGVLADLARLQRAGNGSGEVLSEDADVGVSVAAPEWRPPQGQQGDGRTKLNDLLGY